MLTFDVHDVFPYLLLKNQIRDRVRQVVKRVDAWMDTLKTLDLLLDEPRISVVRIILKSLIHHHCVIVIFSEIHTIIRLQIGTLV